MVLFKVTINSTDRTASNYPVYVVNHLYNSNPTFDYGAFTQLAYLIANTNVSISSFAHVFTEAGTYVFQDAQDSTRLVTSLSEVRMQLACMVCGGMGLGGGGGEKIYHHITGSLYSFSSLT